MTGLSGHNETKGIVMGISNLLKHPKLKNIYNLLFGLNIFLLLGCINSDEQLVEIRGIYGSPKPFWDQEKNLSDLGVNAIFVHSGSINQNMVERAKNEGLKIYAEFATLNGKGYVETHPEAWPINEKGERVELATWFMGVCPTDSGFRSYRFFQLRELLSKYDLDGVWMDYVHWHAQFEDPDPILPETCFCDRCLEKFSTEKHIQLPEGETSEKSHWILNNVDQDWRDWRCEVIVEWAVAMRSIINDIKPGALLGLYHCPWQDDEYNGANRRILGLDYDLLIGVIDIFSPMVYHGRMERSPEWVSVNIEWFSKRLNIQEDKGPKLWPIVQAYNDPHVISPREFEIVLKGGLAGKSSGVMMFTSYAVAEDSAKTEVMKKIYTSFTE